MERAHITQQAQNFDTMTAYAAVDESPVLSNSSVLLTLWFLFVMVWIQKISKLAFSYTSPIDWALCLTSLDVFAAKQWENLVQKWVATCHWVSNSAVMPRLCFYKGINKFWVSFFLNLILSYTIAKAQERFESYYQLASNIPLWKGLIVLDTTLAAFSCLLPE